MKKYDLGIMSSKWSIEAPSLDIAVATLRIASKTTAPIIAYNTQLVSKFMTTTACSLETWENFVDDNVDEIRIAYRTMQLL